MKRTLIMCVCVMGVMTAAMGQKKKAKVVEKSANTGLSIVGNAILRPVKDAVNVGFDYKQIGAPIPQFEVHSWENKVITDELLAGAGSVFLIMFNPTCEHCEDLARLIKENIFLFKKSKVLMVAADVQTPNLSYFEAIVKCSEVPSTMTVAIDSARVIRQLFNYKSLPQINIYDGKTKRLVKYYDGFVPLDSLRGYIN